MFSKSDGKEGRSVALRTACWCYWEGMVSSCAIKRLSEKVWSMANNGVDASVAVSEIRLDLRPRCNSVFDFIQERINHVKAYFDMVT